MKSAFWFLLLFGVVVPSEAGRRRAVASGFDTRRILWIAAHPDDEIVVAPLLGRLCIEQGSTCSFLVLRRGEGGLCALPEGCGSDLGLVRAQEMASAATFFKARLTQWDLPDIMENVASSWDSKAGNHDELIARIRGVVERENPTTIITFDPAHGTTCHPAHRQTAELVIEAVDDRSLFLLETAASFNEEGHYIFSNALPGSTWAIEVSGQWHYLLADVGIHRSQFSAAQADSLSLTPTEQRIVWLAPAASARGGHTMSCR